MTKVALSLCLALPLVACDGAPEAAPAAAGEAAGAKSPTPKTGPAAPAGNPHAGAAPKAAHGGSMPANPHAGMKGMKGMGGAPAPTKLGPPRDVAPSGDTSPETLAEFSLAVPKEWEKGTPSGMMRMAQWVIPGPGGDAELVVYRFKGGAGGVDANMTRWKGQFTPPEGKTADDIATQAKKTVGALTMHTLDVTGRYTAAMVPGADAKHDNPDHRMLAVIVEGSGDPLFFKAVGPAKTLGVWGESWATMLDTIKTGAEGG